LKPLFTFFVELLLEAPHSISKTFSLTSNTCNKLQLPFFYSIRDEFVVLALDHWIIFSETPGLKKCKIPKPDNVGVKSVNFFQTLVKLFVAVAMGDGGGTGVSESMSA
jgi:hypothetical protein